MPLGNCRRDMSCLNSIKTALKPLQCRPGVSLKVMNLLPSQKSRTVYRNIPTRFTRYVHRRYSSMPSQTRIAIVGGGPAGLTLGVLLNTHHIPFTIFEYRQKPTEKELAKPSGMLDLHPESGLAALKECGLYEPFLSLTGECTEDFIIADKSGSVLHTLTGDRTRPEISRNNLAKLLSSNLPTESIKWGHKLISATRQATLEGFETELDFGSLGKHTFDFVVGADGAWSQMRRLLTDVRPQYTGMQHITTTIEGITKKHPHLTNLVGSGSFSCLGNKHAIISQRGSMDSSRIYLWLTLPEKNYLVDSGLDKMTAAEAKVVLLSDEKLLGTFDAKVKDLVAIGCEEESANNPEASVDIRALYKLPHGTSWEHKAGVTLVGDAAHLMLPNGEGVNSAMLDSLLLSHIVVKACKPAEGSSRMFQRTLDPLLVDFEASLVKRAKSMGEDTDELIDTMFGTEDAAYELVRFFQGAQEQVNQ
ncbi:putative salicylate hydroxylase protein [Lipomyces kononenkoae]